MPNIFVTSRNSVRLSRGVRGVVCVALIVLGCGFVVRAQNQAPQLLRNPTLSRTQIAFSYAGSIWIANRNGSDVRRLTTGGHEGNPSFSPDGSEIAFTGDYDGTRGIYVVATAGGVPRQLTYHPADGSAIGWTPDGRQILFTSARAAFADGVVQLFTVPVSGGFATPVPLVRASEGSYSQDGSHIAYVPNVQWQAAWK